LSAVIPDSRAAGGLIRNPDMTRAIPGSLALLAPRNDVTINQMRYRAPE
jgi:hypothetical protein